MRLSPKISLTDRLMSDVVYVRPGMLQIAQNVERLLDGFGGATTKLRDAVEATLNRTDGVVASEENEAERCCDATQLSEGAAGFGRVSFVQTLQHFQQND